VQTKKTHDKTACDFDKILYNKPNPSPPSAPLCHIFVSYCLLFTLRVTSLHAINSSNTIRHYRQIEEKTIFVADANYKKAFHHCVVDGEGLVDNAITAPLYLRTLWRYRNCIIISIIIIIITNQRVVLLLLPPMMSR